MNGPRIIGYFIWWTIVNQHVRRDKLQKLIKDAGLKDSRGKEFKLKEPRNRTAFLKAVREVRYQYKDKGILIRKIKKDSASYVFGLVDERLNEQAKKLKYSHSATLHFLQDTGKIRVDRSHRAYSLIKAKYTEYKNYMNSNDIRDIIMDIVSQPPNISVRNRGGIYFIPMQFEYLVEQLETLINSLSGTENDASGKLTRRTASGSYLAVAPQIDTEQSKKAIYKAFVADLKVKLDESEKLVEGLDTYRPTALRNRLDDFKKLSAEIEFYKDTLQFQVEDLSVSLAKLTRKFTRQLNE